MKRLALLLCTALAICVLGVLPASAAVAVTIDAPTNGASLAPGFSGTMDVTFTFVPTDPDADYTLQVTNKDTAAVVASVPVHITPSTMTSPHSESLAIPRLAPGNYGAEVLDATSAVVAENLFTVQQTSATITSPMASSFDEGYHGTMRASVAPVGDWTLTFEIRRNGVQVFQADGLSAATSPVTAAFPKLRDGSYVANAIDEWGTTLDTVAFTVKDLKVTDADASPDPFYPLVRDGYRDTTKLTWTQSLAGTDSVRIKNHGKFHLGSFSAGHHGWRWNGRTPSGRKLSPGLYYLRVTVVDKYGARASSPWVPVHIATGWKTVSKSMSQSGSSVDGTKVWSKPCAFARNYYQRGDAVVACGAGGKGALFYEFTVPRTTVSSSIRANFKGRADSGPGKIFGGVYRAKATLVVSYIGVHGKRVLEIVKALLRFDYKVRI